MIGLIEVATLSPLILTCTSFIDDSRDDNILLLNFSKDSLLKASANSLSCSKSLDSFASILACAASTSAVKSVLSTVKAIPAGYSENAPTFETMAGTPLEISIGIMPELSPVLDLLG